MRAFETVRTIYLVMYALIWAIALLTIIGSFVGFFTESLQTTPLPMVIGAVAAVVVLAMILSWLILITICTIDSRNFLADIHQHLLVTRGDNTQSRRDSPDRFDRPI